jgi:hypothetical protein
LYTDLKGGLQERPNLKGYVERMENEVSRKTQDMRNQESSTAADLESFRTHSPRLYYLEQMAFGVQA